METNRKDETDRDSSRLTETYADRKRTGSTPPSRGGDKGEGEVTAPPPPAPSPLKGEGIMEKTTPSLNERETTPVSASLNQSQSVSSYKVAYSFVTRNYLSDIKVGSAANDGKYPEEAGAGWIPSNKVRLFPNDRSIRFVNPVHELVEPSLEKAGVKIAHCEIPVHHYGKLDRKKDSSKHESYYEIGKKKVSGNAGRDLKAVLELAYQAGVMGKYEEAEGYYGQVIADTPNHPKALYGLGTVYLSLGKFGDALALLKKAVESGSRSADIIVLYATCEICAGNPETAMEYLEGLIKDGYNHPVATATLAIAYFCAGRRDQGLQYLGLLRKMRFDYAGHFTGFANMLTAAGRMDCARRLLEAIGNKETNRDSPETDRDLMNQSSGRLLKKSQHEPSVMLNSFQHLVSGSGRRDEILKQVQDDKRASALKRVQDDNKHTGPSGILKRVYPPLAAPKATRVQDDKNRLFQQPSEQPVSISLNQSQQVSSSNVAYSFVTRNYVAQINTAGWTANEGVYKNEEAGSGWFPGEKVRLFPNDSRFHFAFALHERIEPSLIKSGIEIKTCDIPIHHYGNFVAVEKKEAKAEQYYELGKRKSAAEGEKNFMALYELAVQASALGKYEEALDYIKKVTALKPDFAKAYQSSGNVYYNLGKYEEALPFYKKALKLDPGSRDAVLMYSTCELLAGDMGKSVAPLEKLVKNNPLYPQAMLVLAEAYLCTGAAGKALQLVRRLKDMKFDVESAIVKFAGMLVSAGRQRYAVTLLEGIAGNDIAADEAKALLEELREKGSGDNSP